MRWINYEGDDCYAIVTCKYVPINSHHMELQIGDFVFIKEQYPGWYRGFKYSQPGILKIFPNTHVKILSSEIHPDLWAEIFSYIPNIRETYLLTDNNEFDQVCEAVQLALSEKRFDCLQEKIRVTDANKRALVLRMETARKMLGLPIESRNEKSEKLDLNNVSILDLYIQHNKVHENNRNISGQFDNSAENMSIFLKMLNINFEKSINLEEKIEVIISLYNKIENKGEEKVKICRISEVYISKVGIRMNQCDLVKSNAIVTKDIQFATNQKTFLVFQFIRIGQMHPKTNNRHRNEVDCQHRRPLGVSVLEITSSIIEAQDITRQIGINVMQKEDSIENVTESMIQDEKVSRGDYRSTISIQFKIIRPDEFTDRHIVINGLNPYYPSSIRSKRNCIYLTISRGVIDRGKKKSDPNFEIEISIRDDKGNLVCMPNDDWRSVSNYKSVIYYHMGKPRWNELMCIPLFGKLEMFPSNTHIRFVVWHRSLNGRGKAYGVAYLKLFPKPGSLAILSNREHDLAVFKLTVDEIKNAKYLELNDEIDGISESLSNSLSMKPKGYLTMGRKSKPNIILNLLCVQTLLISNEYSFDDLLANICCSSSIDQTIMYNLMTQEVVVKNIDVNEIKKFAIKILESSLELLQRANDTSLLGRNILILMGEMFKAIKNLPDYQSQINKFINDTMHFNVHKQILNELINHVPEIDSNTLRASDWFVKIVVKSYQNLEAEFFGNADDTIIFNDMVDQYLQKLESWANCKENTILRSIVLSKAGPIINALIPVCRPIGMARLVNNLLEASRDLDAITKAGLTMDCMNSRLFSESDCRKIILPETTRNILELFSTQLNKIFHGREIDQDHMLDNICEKMTDFMQLHERSWLKSSPDSVDMLVYEFLIENNMLRESIAIVSSGLEFLRKEDFISKLLHKPLMVLVSVIITSLKFMSNNLWEKLITQQMDVCAYCSSQQTTNIYDIILELFALFKQLQLTPVFPDSSKPDEEINRLPNSKKEVAARQHRHMKQPWLDMFFLQSKQFLATIGQIHKIIIRPYYLHNMAEIQRKRPITVCCCHPSEKLQNGIVDLCVESIGLIITQHILMLEELPPSSSLRLMQNSKEWEGDIRLWGAILIKDIWHDLDILKINFAQVFFKVFSKLTTIPNYKIRLLAVQCMFDIVHLDHQKMKTELITQIDQAMEKADSTYCEEMSKALKQVLSGSARHFVDDSRLVENIMVQMKNIQECSHHLNDNSPINGMIVINNLRKFYEKMGRSDIIGRYLFKLMAIHAKIKNFTEMGYTLLELSSFYKWSHDLVLDTFFPEEYSSCEFEWQLKAQLLEESLKYFEQEDWEQGIEVCKELVKGYTDFIVDFVKLSEVYKKMAELFKNIMYNDRPESLAYIIFYIGNGFPKFITELPHRSVVLTTKCNANELSMNLNSQFLNTTVEKRFPTDIDTQMSVKKIFFMPIKCNNFDIPSKYEGKFVKQRILRYFENYKIDEFVYKTLLNSTEEDPKKRKIEGCIIKCDGKLPNILSVAPVRSLFREIIDPFNEALHDLQNQIRKDCMLYQDYEIATQEKRETMYQKMKDVIIKYISPVSGGVTKLVEMIPENDESKLSYAGEVVSQVFTLIFQYFETFEIYDTVENYNIFLTEFRKVIKTVSSKLDICEEDFNINSLIEQFTRSRKNTNNYLTARKQSLLSRPRHDEENQMTLNRKPKIPKEFYTSGEISNDARNSGIMDDEHFQMTPQRQRIDLPESALLFKRQSVVDTPILSARPLPSKVMILPNNSSQSGLNGDPPTKPIFGFGNDFNFLSAI